MIGANDLFIAAHTRCLGITLVTNNTRELARITGLNLENWTNPIRSKLAIFALDICPCGQRIGCRLAESGFSFACWQTIHESAVRESMSSQRVPCCNLEMLVGDGFPG